MIYEHPKEGFKSVRSSFSKALENIMHVAVVDEEGEHLSPESVRVQIFLSQEGLVRLGTELMRAASDELSGKKICLSGILGGSIHPDSPDLEISHKEFGPLLELL